MGICEIDRIAREGERAGKIMSQRNKPRQGAVANTLNVLRNGASLLAKAFGVVFIDWLGMPNCLADSAPRRFQPQPRRAIAAMSILFISIMASNARFAAAEAIQRAGKCS